MSCHTFTIENLFVFHIPNLCRVREKCEKASAKKVAIAMANLFSYVGLSLEHYIECVDNELKVTVLTFPLDHCPGSEIPRFGRIPVLTTHSPLL
jgi:hypothetical protein